MNPTVPAAGHPTGDGRRVILPPVLRCGTIVPAGAQVGAGHAALEATDGRIVNRTTSPVHARVVVRTAGTPDSDAAPDTFDVTVLPAGAPTLLAGTRHPHADPAVYAPRIAFSLHLTLAMPDGTITRLNDDRGVLFASSVPTEDLDVRRVRTLTDPWVFAVPGGYAVVASPATSDGTPEDVASSSVLLFRSPDLVTYDEIGLVPVGGGGGVRRPRAVYDSARAEYVMFWTDDSGRDWWSRATRLHGPWTPQCSGSPLVPGPALPDVVPDRVVSCALPLPEADAQRLLRRFGRIRNIAVEVPALPTTAGAPPCELPWATLTYDDGSTARRPVDWDPAGVAGVDWDTPGEYVVTGTVRQRDYPFPFVVDRADPTVLAYQGRYYFIATDDPDGHCVTTPNLLIRVADSIAELATAPDHAILGVGPAGIAGCFWAPELHVIGGRLHCLFAPSIGAAEWSRVQCHVMRLRDGGDPVEAADWEPPRPVLQHDGTPLRLDPEHPGLSLDMTYLEDGGRGYVIWSQRYVTAQLGDAELWIATIDPADPWRLTSAPVRLVTAEYGWDHNVAEGPFMIRHDDRVVVTYSGSNVGPTYAAGMVAAPSGADLLDPGVWSKVPVPVLATGSNFDQWGPGHNTFSRDEDGVELVVFHAHPTITTRGRCTAIRRIHWAADGHLVLDQRPEEEVAPHLRQVRTVVHVAPRAEPR